MRFVQSAEKIPDVSIVIPCRNEAAHVRALIESLHSQDTADLQCEVLIADGTSDDGTREILDEWSRNTLGVRIIDNPERIVSTGLNRAILAARGEIIVRLDAHTEYAADYIAACVRVLKTKDADNVGGAMRNAGCGRFQRAVAAAFHSPFSCGGAKFHNIDYEGYVDTVTYGCWRKATLLELGLFDPALVRNQDDELNLRLTRRGGKIWQSPEIVMSYHPRASVKALWMQYFQYGFWKVAVIRKHRLPASWRHLVPGSFVLALAALPVLAATLFVLGFTATAWLISALWLLILGAYLTAAAIASAMAVLRKDWSLTPVLPFVFAMYHFAYGIGFLTALTTRDRRTKLR